MFFAKAGVYEPCGLYNIKHLVIALITILSIEIAVKITKIKKKEDVTKVIKIATIIVWVLEITKIVFLILTDQGKPNNVIPLYYCSMLLYSGLISSFGKGFIKKMGDVFLATGGVFGGITYLLFPTTTLPAYPLFHFISMHSFFFHGTMIYLGIIINKYKYVELKLSDIKYYSSLVFIICIVAYIVNKILDSNLMFISKDFPEMPISIVYNGTGIMFTPIMILIQMIAPFLIMYEIIHSINRIKVKQ